MARWLTFDKPFATLLTQLFRMLVIISKVVTSVICDRYELDILQLEPRHTHAHTQLHITPACKHFLKRNHWSVIKLLSCQHCRHGDWFNYFIY